MPISAYFRSAVRNRARLRRRVFDVADQLARVLVQPGEFRPSNCASSRSLGRALQIVNGGVQHVPP